jgi:hypothetical protein
MAISLGMIAVGRIVCKRGVGSGLNLLNLDTYLTSEFLPVGVTRSCYNDKQLFAFAAFMAVVMTWVI